MSSPGPLPGDIVLADQCAQRQQVATLTAAIFATMRSSEPSGISCMAMIESTPSLLVLKDRWTTVTLDKITGHATLQQRILLWSRKPVEFDLSDIDDIAVTSEMDGLSGSPIYHSVMHRRTGETMVLTTEEAKDAETTVKRLREFVGLTQ